MIGIDVVDIERFRRVLQRVPGIARRLFTERERRYCSSKHDPVVHFAGTLGAKEAVAKATGLGSLAAFGRRIEIERDRLGKPMVRLNPGSIRSPIHISIAHDGPVAVAIAIDTRALTPGGLILPDAQQSRKGD